MPTPSLPVNLTAHSLAKAADVMADFDELVSILDANVDGDNLKAGTPGQLWVCDSGGKSQLKTISQDLSIGTTGVAKADLETHVGKGSGDLTLAANTYNDIPGLSFTATEAGAFLIAVVASFHGTTATSTSGEATMSLRGAVGFTILNGISEYVTPHSPGTSPGFTWGGVAVGIWLQPMNAGDNFHAQAQGDSLLISTLNAKVKANASMYAAVKVISS